MLAVMGLVLLSVLPHQVYNAVQIPGGWATPIIGNRLITAAHVVEKYKNGEVLYISQIGELAKARIMCIDLVNDIAILVYAGESMRVVIVGKPPEVQSELFWRAYLIGSVPTAVRGYYLGADKQGDLNVDGWVAQGASGSPLIDAKGELIGIIFSSGNQNLAKDNPEEDLSVRTSFRSLTYAKPLNVGKCKVTK